MISVQAMTLATPLTNPSETELAGAVQENLFALFRAMAHAMARAEIVEDGLPYPPCVSRLNPMFKGSGVPGSQGPFLFWGTGRGTTPADLGARLQARGLLDMAEQQAALAPGIKHTELRKQVISWAVRLQQERLWVGVGREEQLVDLDAGIAAIKPDDMGAGCYLRLDARIRCAILIVDPLPGGDTGAAAVRAWRKHRRFAARMPRRAALAASMRLQT